MQLLSEVIPELPKAFIEKMLRDRRLISPLLFHGPAGSGKRALADYLAREILIRSGSESAALKLDKAIHPDLHYILPESKSHLHTIQAIHEMIEDIQLPPFESSHKIYIILEAERMLPVHANALLKTLEEPHDRVIVILITSALVDILPTITSRCMQVPFFPSKVAPAVDPSIEALVITALKQALGRDFVGLYATFEQLEPLLAADLDPLFTTLLAWWRDLALIKSDPQTTLLHFSDERPALLACNTLKLIPLSTLSHKIDQIKEATIRHIRPKYSLEYLFLALRV